MSHKHGHEHCPHVCCCPHCPGRHREDNHEGRERVELQRAFHNGQKAGEEHQRRVDREELRRLEEQVAYAFQSGLKEGVRRALEVVRSLAGDGEA
jgi:hypothetical protein